MRAVGDEIGISLLRTNEAFVGGECVCVRVGMADWIQEELRWLGGEWWRCHNRLKLGDAA